MTAAPSAMNQNDSKSLFVDLDKSLISTDTLWESMIVLFKGHPFALFKVPFWLLKGKAGFKNERFQKTFGRRVLKNLWLYRMRSMAK